MKKNVKKGKFLNMFKNKKRIYKQQLNFETLIATLSSKYITIEPENMEKVIHHWIIEIAETLEAEVAVLFRRKPKGNLFISDFWRKEYFNEPIMYDPAQTFPYLTAAVLQGDLIAVSSYSDLPEEAEIDKENLQKLGTTSFLFFPLGMGKHILGAFLFAYKTKKVDWDEAFINKLRFVVHIFSSVIKSEHDRKILEEKIQYESFLADLSRDFISVKTDEIDDKITYWLHKSAETLGFDRALIFKLSSHGKFYLSKAWRSEKGKEVIPYDPEELFPWMKIRIMQSIPIVIPDPTAFPEEASKDKDSMNIIGALSVLVLPLQVENRIVGALAFSSTEPQFNLAEDLVQRFQIISQVFATALLRQKTERNLAEEKERLAVTLESIGDGVITTDVFGNITLLNNIAEKLTGWTLSEAKGKSIHHVFQIMDDRTEEMLPSPVERVLKTDSIVTLKNHTLLVDKTGNRKLIADSGAPIKDTNGNILGVVLVFRDITIEKKQETDILKLKKLESIGILAGGLAHDFNNILTGIMGNIDLAIMSGSNTQDAHSYLEKASKGCQRATSLTQKLLTFSKGGSPVKENASIGEIVTESIDFVLHGSNIKMEWFIPEDLWTTEVDKDQISQVIQNLILNSAESMPDGGIISVTCKNITFDNNHHHPGNYIQVNIKDTGIGISKENIDKIFDPYFSTKETGSGLGLAVTYSIIYKHSGFIDVKSEPGKGTEFSLYLPVTTNCKTDRKLSEKITHKHTKNKYSILAMDDEAEIRNLLEIMLKKLGHTVTIVTHGEQAIEKYKKKKFDLVILDITIPGGMGGIETMEQLKNIDPNAKGIVSSGYANSPVMSNYKLYGFCGALTKPFLMNNLKDTIDSVMIS